MSRKPEYPTGFPTLQFRVLPKGYGDDMEEVWKDIAGYEGLYQVSNFGRVKSLDRVVKRKNQPDLPVAGKVLRPRFGKNGYAYVILSKEGKGKTANIHRIVAMTFLERFDGCELVNHKDGNKANNCVENLEWCNFSRIMQHAFDNGLVSKEKIAKSVMNPNKQNKSNTSGRKGVYFNKKIKKWQAYIRINGVQTYLGVYENIEDAIRAREKKEKELM